MTSPILPGVPTPLPKPILPGVPTPQSKPILPGVPTPQNKQILPGVPTPLGRPNLAGVQTPFLFTAKSQEVVDQGQKFAGLLTTLEEIIHPNLKGRYGLRHPNCCRGGLHEVQSYFSGNASNNSQDQRVLTTLKKAADRFVPIYEEYVGRGVHFPGEGNPTTRFVNSAGEEISKAAFEAIAAKFETALAETLDVILKGDQAKPRAYVSPVSIPGSIRV